MKSPKAVTDFWFGPLADANQVSEMRGKWFTKDQEFDNLIKENFEADIFLAEQGQYNHWKETGLGYLALIILLDQFPRNIFRGTARSFSFDSISLTLCKEAINNGKDKELFPLQRSFVYMPLMHSEDINDHQLFIDTLTPLIEEAEGDIKANLQNDIDDLNEHSDIIRQFGRYPHRNSILERESTREEEEFTKNHPGF